MIRFWGSDVEQDYFGAFRAQLRLPTQRQVFDYWLSKCHGRTMPSRVDLNPVEIPRLLPNLSLIAVAQDLKMSTIRLAGTRLRDIHDRDITGHVLGDIDWHQHGTYWSTAFHNTVVQGEPTHGTVKDPSPDRSHLLQVWLRLPLSSCANGKVDMVLGFDSLVVVNQQRAAQNLV